MRRLNPEECLGLKYFRTDCLSEGGACNSNSAVLEDVKKISDLTVHTLCEPATGSPGCEIIFISGPQISKCKDKIWKRRLAEVKDKGLDNVMFKRWACRLFQKFPTARILSLLYDSSDIKWTGEAGENEIRSLVESLLQNIVGSANIGQREKCPVVFFCQSLGGLVVKEAVVQACKAHSHNYKYQSLLENIRGFLFYATPHEWPKPSSCVSHLPGMGKAATKIKKPKEGNDMVGCINERFEHTIVTLKSSNGWRIENVPEAKQTALRRLFVVLQRRSFVVLRRRLSVALQRRLSAVLQHYMRMGSMPLLAENFRTDNLKSDKASDVYDLLLELVHGAMDKQSDTENDFKVSVSKLFSSTREDLKRVQINVSQCNRLVNRIADVIKELEVHESTLEGEALAKVHDSLLILLTRSRSLVAQCGGSEWMETALIRADNKEAFEEVHKELTNFLLKYMEFSRTVGGSTSGNAANLPPLALRLDAERDLRDLLKKLKSYKECACKSLNPEQPSVVHHLSKIIEVVSDKSKDNGSIPAGEQDLSASYLMIPRSEIVLKLPIGTGSYGEVHEAEWLGCKVCLKDFPWSGGYGEQLLVQAMPMLRLRHPNVLQVVGFSAFSLAGESKPQQKVLTEIMEGDIRSLIDRRMAEQNGKGTPFKWSMTVDIMTQVARGLDYMHTNGFMHGDRVLTTNIIIKVCGDYIDARIGDFGVPLNFTVKYEHVCEPRMGDPGGAETARWTAPENSAGAAFYSPASDIYSFGIFCYEVLTGRKPLDLCLSVPAIHAQILTGEVRPELPGDLDQRVVDIIKECWHADPSSRPTARAIVADLEAIQFPVIAKEKLLSEVLNQEICEESFQSDQEQSKL